MKILIVLIRWKGGVGRVIESTKPFLEKEGNTVEVISREDDLKCFSLKDSFMKLRKEVKKRDYDILYTQDWSCTLPLLGLKNHFCCLYGNETHKFGRIFQNFIGKLFGKKLIVVNPLVKERFPKSHLLYIGINLKEFKNLKLRREKGTVGFANWHNSEYNYEEIKKAVESLGLKLVDTELKLSKEELVRFYNKIETFISLPKEHAGFNMTWIEAMACKVPKIIGNYNGIGRMHNINHLEDFENIEDAIKNAKTPKNYIIPKEFNWEVHANKLLGIFKENE